MRRTPPSPLALLLVLAVQAAARPSGAAVLWNLGDFEAGTMSDWQVTQWAASGDAAYWDVSDDGTYSPRSGLPAYAPSGSYQAVSDVDGNYVTSILYREFVVPATADSLKLRFWYRGSDVSDMPSLAPGGQGQGVRVDLMNPAQPVAGMAGIHATLFATSFPANAASELLPRTLALGVQAWRGQSVRLRIAVAHNTAPMVTGVDDVRIEGAQFVEVATGLPGLRDGAARWGDLDDDGDLDLALMGSDGAANVTGIWRNDGGAFSLVASAPTALRSGDLEWLDVDRDGDLDLYATGLDPSGFDVLAWWATNQGAGSFSWTAASVMGCKGNVALADADADGDSDLLVGAFESLNVMSSGDAPATVTNGGSGYVVSVDSLTFEWDSGTLPGFFVSGRKGPFSPLYTPIAMAKFGNLDGGRRFAPTYLFTDGAVAAGVRARTDANGDGAEELFWSGRDITSGALWSSVQQIETGVPNTHDVPPLYQPFAAWADLDADGDQDLLVGGNDGASRYTSVHRWQSAGLSASSDGLAPLARGACAVGDYDGDGDPDLLLLGDASGGPATRLYRNVLTTPNLPPAAPPAAAAVTDATFLRLTCAAASDDHTPAAGLSYNFRAGGAPGAADVVLPASDAATGRRQVARRGNTNGWNRREYPLLWEHLGATHAASLYWAAQAIDGAGAGGAWSAENVVHVGGRAAAITDVPGDQGGFARVRITASALEAVTSTSFAVQSYTVWRRVDSAAQQLAVERAAAVTATPAEAPRPVSGLGTIDVGGHAYVTRAAAAAAGFPAGTWEAIGTVPALQQAEYLVAVPTVADSGASGPHWSVLVVSTHTTKPSTWWVSRPDSGKSVDNIAPGVPQGLAAQYHTGGGNRLAWQPSNDEDFQYFRIYRGDAPGFATSPATLAAATSQPEWTDPAHDAAGVYYKVTTVDHAGNESLAAAPGMVTEVADAPAAAFALAAPSPSPFTGSTRLAFTLPRAAVVTLEAFDAGGRRVRTLAHGAFAAGAHELSWDGRGEDGESLGPGLLFVRLRADGREAVRRVISLGAGR